MSFYYSASERAFFSSDVMSVEAMPYDKVEVVADVYRALIADQNAGKVIQPGAGGAPEAVEQSLSEATGMTYDLPAATSEKLGLVKIGEGVNVSQDGTISVDTAILGEQSSWSTRVALMGYELGDIIDCPFKRNLELVCIQAGTTGERDLKESELTHGVTIDDGTVKWNVRAKIKTVNGKGPDDKGNVDVDLSSKRDHTVSVANADLNKLLEDKTYSCSGTLKNTPITCTFCIVEAYDTGAPVSGNIVQVCYIPNQTDNTVRTFKRNCLNGATFGKWTESGAVNTVNGIAPDANGNISIPTATASTYGLVKAATDTIILDEDADDVAITPAVYHNVSDFRHKSTSYALGDKVECMFNFELFLECTKEGTTSENQLDTGNVKHGQVLNDGTVQWTVRTHHRSTNGVYPDDKGDVKLDAKDLQFTKDGGVQRTLDDKLGDIVSVKDFGAKGDGVTDDTAAFENASNAVSRRGLALVPSGDYKLTKTVPGMFLSIGRVTTSEAIDIVDINFFKTRQFRDRLDLGMCFTYPVPWESQDSRFYLQGYCTDNDDAIFFGLRTSSHSAQKIIRYSVATGETVVKDFTTLWHVNGMTHANGKLYVVPMKDDLPHVVVFNAATLEQEGTIELPNVGAAGGAVAYDSFTDRFFYYENKAVHVFDSQWRFVKKIPWTYPDWTPPVGQSYGAYKGLLFFARSADTTFTTTRHEAILVFDTDKCEVVWQWFIGGSYGELESVSFFKNKLLLGFNDGSHEIPFYLAEFDMSSKYMSPQPTEELLQYNGPYFGNLSQETISVYCDASAKAPGDGTEQRPFNSLKRALWSTRRVGTPYRAVIYVAGDATRNPFEYIQGSWRLLQIMPWAGKAHAVIPPLRIFDSTVRIGAVTVKGLDSYSEVVAAINSENSSLDLRGTKFDPAGSDLSPNRYVNILRGEFMSTGLDFSLTGTKLPSSGYVTVYGGGSLCLLEKASAFVFPDTATDVTKFAGYALCSTQYADCRNMITCQAYIGSKTSAVFDSDGTGVHQMSLLTDRNHRDDPDWSQDAENALTWFRE